MPVDERLPDVLRDAAGLLPREVGDWDELRSRGAARRRRRSGRVAAAVVAAVGVAAGTLAATGTFSGGTDHSVVVTSTAPPAPTEIVIALRDRIVVASASDGRVIRTLVDGLSVSPGTVAAAPNGAIYFSRDTAGLACTSGSGAAIYRVPAGGGTPTTVVRGFTPVVSPDGHWLAYATYDCTRSRTFLGITDLRTGANYRPYEQDFARHGSKLAPLAWSRSDQLIYTVLRDFPGKDQQRTFILRDPPLAHGGTPTRFLAHRPVGAATFLPNGRVLVASSHDVLEVDPSGHTVGRRTRVGAAALTADPTGTRLLLTLATGDLFVQDDRAAPRLIGRDVQGVAWLPRTAPSAGGS